jgi:hypothetical protein
LPQRLSALHQSRARHLAASTSQPLEAADQPERDKIAILRNELRAVLRDAGGATDDAIALLREAARIEDATLAPRRSLSLLGLARAATAEVPGLAEARQSGGVGANK